MMSHGLICKKGSTWYYIIHRLFGANLWAIPYIYTWTPNISKGCFDFVLVFPQLMTGELKQNFESDIKLSVFIHIQKPNWIGQSRTEIKPKQNRNNPYLYWGSKCIWIPFLRFIMNIWFFLNHNVSIWTNVIKEQFGAGGIVRSRVLSICGCTSL